MKRSNQVDLQLLAILIEGGNSLAKWINKNPLLASSTALVLISGFLASKHFKIV